MFLNYNWENFKYVYSRTHVLRRGHSEIRKHIY
ncbi:unnamed protein product [Gulo gulo]|uniref:Uncharacterized protein n=1 Tax=Gulo gulo TaxID=48420 RepID=A0A9X9LY43_GULGU|nr:unnamed protein product [Gulo gulo]